MTFSPKTVCLLGVLALATGATGALAQDAASHEMSKTTTTETSHTMMHDKNASMHSMPATVEAVDTTTGIVDVKSGDMALKLHFPPASVANLKSGDSITVHLSFTKQ